MFEGFEIYAGTDISSKMHEMLTMLSMIRPSILILLPPLVGPELGIIVISALFGILLNSIGVPTFSPLKLMEIVKFPNMLSGIRHCTQEEDNHNAEEKKFLLEPNKQCIWLDDDF